VNWLNPLNRVGAYGIHSNTNRFYHYVYDNEFNNIRFGFSLNTPAIPANYSLGNSTISQGIYAHLLYLERNYFGPEVASNVLYSLGSPNTSEYMDEAIQVLTPNTTGLTYPAQSATTAVISAIIHNRIDRAYRGVHIDGLEDFPLAVEGNSIYVEDDFTYGSPGVPAFGYGIGLMNSTDNKSIISNTISGISSIPISAISAVFCKLNLGNNSPNVHCNFTSNSYYGFQFDDWNGDAIWEGNNMCNEWAGLALTNNGIIGQQGGTFGCDNGWEEAPLYPLCQLWGAFAPSGSGYQTYVDQTMFDHKTCFKTYCNGVKGP
jgi:hypothetical protein